MTTTPLSLLTQWYNQSTPLLIQIGQISQSGCFPGSVTATLPFAITTLIDYGGIIEIGDERGATITLNLACAIVHDFTHPYSSGMTVYTTGKGGSSGEAVYIWISPIDSSDAL